MPALTLLPLDLKGTKPSNRIQNEQRTLVKLPDRPHRVLIPRLGAFYADTNLRLVDKGRLLKAGVDYTTTYLYRELTHLTGKPIYAFIVITNTTVSNSITLDYQAVGGPFGLDVSELQALLEEIDTGDQNRVSFEDIINKPKAYNPIDHMDEYWQLYGADNTVTVIDRIGAVIGHGTGGVEAELDAYSLEYLSHAQAAIDERKDLLTDHLNDTHNPHQDNQADVGLSELHNWPMATAEEHANATVDNRYTHPQGGLRAITEGPLAKLQEHITDYSNPHQTRATDVDAYTTAELNSRFNGKLGRNDAAYNTLKLFGMTLEEFKTYVTAGLNASAFTQGTMRPEQMGTGTGSSTTFLMGDGNFTPIHTLISRGEALYPPQKIISVRNSVASTSVGVIDHANATFTDLATYPIGTILVYHIENTFASIGSQYEMKALQRDYTGWTYYIP